MIEELNKLMEKEDLFKFIAEFMPKEDKKFTFRTPLTILYDFYKKKKEIKLERQILLKIEQERRIKHVSNKR